MSDSNHHHNMSYSQSGYYGNYHTGHPAPGYDEQGHKELRGRRSTDSMDNDAGSFDGYASTAYGDARAQGNDAFTTSRSATDRFVEEGCETLKRRDEFSRDPKATRREHKKEIYQQISGLWGNSDPQGQKKHKKHKDRESQKSHKSQGRDQKGRSKEPRGGEKK